MSSKEKRRNARPPESPPTAKSLLFLIFLSVFYTQLRKSGPARTKPDSDILNPPTYHYASPNAEALPPKQFNQSNAAI
eukprot:726870-Amphidinium_carterae.1